MIAVPAHYYNYWRAGLLSGIQTPNLRDVAGRGGLPCFASSINSLGRTKSGLVLAVALSLVAAWTSPVSAQASPREEANKRVVLEFYVKGIRGGDPDAAIRNMAPDMIEHNPRVPGRGPEALREFINSMPATARAAPPRILRVIADGEYVVLHVHNQRSTEDAGTQVIEMFRLQDGRIVEHWDVMQPVPTTMANGQPPF